MKFVRHFLRVYFRKGSAGFSLLSIALLAIGFTISSLAVIYIERERKFDRFHTDGDRIYRLTVESGDAISDQVPSPLIPIIQENFPAVEEGTRYYELFSWSDAPELIHNDKIIVQKDLIFPDKSFLKLFDFPVDKGETESALDAPNSIVLTRSMASSLFGGENPLGKIVTYKSTEGQRAVKVTAVLNDVPADSHLQFEALLPFEFYNELIQSYHGPDLSVNWYYNFTNSYVKLRQDVDHRVISEEFLESVRNNFHEERKEDVIHFQPLFDIHLSALPGSNAKNPNRSSLLIAILLSSSILVLTAINYIGLATARSSKRWKEMAMRRISGASSKSILRYILGEQLFLTYLALSLALLLMSLLIPLIYTTTGQWIEYSIWNDWRISMKIFALATVVGLVSGSVPAFLMAKVQPIKALKGELKAGNSKWGLRKVLVTVQITVGLIFLIGALVVSSQLDFMLSKNLGFESENLLYIQLKDDLFGKPEARDLFEQRLKEHPGVLGTATTWELIGSRRPANRNSLFVAEGQPDEPKTGVPLISAGPNYLDLIQVDFMEGRNFDERIKSDLKQSIIVNESFVKEMNWTEGALGKTITLIPPQQGLPPEKKTVVGVVRDFHFESLYSKIGPMMVRTSRDSYAYLGLRYSANSLDGVMSHLEEIWNEMGNSRALEVSFSDDRIENNYKSQRMLGSLIKVLTLISVVICLSGVLSMIVFNLALKRKEIGVRKVLGASILNLLGQLIREYFPIVLIGGMIGIPMAVYVINEWLSTFAYRVTLSPTYFLTGLIIIGFLVIATVLYHSFKAARVNPTEMIRQE